MTRAENQLAALTLGIQKARVHFMSAACDRADSEAWATLIVFAEQARSELVRDVAREKATEQLQQVAA